VLASNKQKPQTTKTQTKKETTETQK